MSYWTDVKFYINHKDDLLPNESKSLKDDAKNICMNTTLNKRIFDVEKSCKKCASDDSNICH